MAGLEENSNLKSLKYDAFRKLWHQLTPEIQIMSPRTDLCDTCQNFRNGLQYNAHQEEARELLKNLKIIWLKPNWKEIITIKIPS